MSIQVYSAESNGVKFRPLVAGAGITIADVAGSITVSAGAAETSGTFITNIGDGTNNFPFAGGTGSWTRIGNLMTFQGFVSWGFGVGSAVGPVRITGLPAMPNAAAAIVLGQFAGIVYNSQVLATQGAGTTYANLVQADETGGGATSLTAASNFLSTGQIFFSGAYYAV
jgi:hypothetical protein